MTDIEQKIRAGTINHPGMSCRRLATLLGVSKSTVYRYSKPGPAKTETRTTYRQDRTTSDADAWHARYTELSRKYDRALKEQAVVNLLVADIKQMAPRSYEPAPEVTARKHRGKSAGKPQSAVLLLSDTHVGKVVEPDQTLGFGLYNFDVFLARLKYLEVAIGSILSDHTNIKVPELVICLLGDMLDGALDHGAEVGQRATLFAQYYSAGHALAQFIRALAARVPKIRLETVVGNHPRWQNQKRMPTENRFSNLDQFLYAFVAALTQDIGNVHWRLTEQPYTLFDVQGWLFHGSHGDHWRGGDKNLGIPNHAIGRSVSVTAQLFNKSLKTGPNYYVAGHLHRPIQIPHASGHVIVNGAFIGLDNYALAESFNPCDPCQLFFFVHPKYGKTASYQIDLQHAAVSDKPPYTLPGEFPL